MPDRIEIPLANGLKLVAERGANPDYPKEMYIGVEDGSGVWIQDLAIVMDAYRYDADGKVEYTNDSFKLMLFEDSNDEDCTQEIYIRLRDDYDTEA